MPGFPKKIPTLFGLVLLVAVMGGIALAFETISRLPASAAPSLQPQNVQMTNLSDTSFTVTWTTQTPATGAIVITVSKREQVTQDERDSTGALGKYLTHSVTVRNLTGDTEYPVKILSNGKTYLDNGKPYVVHTSPVLTTNPGNLDPAYGSIMTSDNKAANGALVFLTLEGSQMLSTLVKPSGAWLIPLNLIRTQDGTSYLSVADERLTETLFVRSDGLESSAIADTLNDSPVPVMILDKNYDFRKQQAKIPEPSLLAQAPSPVPSVLGSQTTAPKTANYAVKLTSPAEGSAIASFLPLIAGTGIPSKLVTITLGITNPTSDTTTVGADGLFRFTPKHPLSAGKQTVTITTVNDQNIPVAITHSFEILKSGTQVLGTATPSATLTPTFAPAPVSTLAGQPLPTSATTFPTVLLITIGFILCFGGIIAFIRTSSIDTLT